MKHEFNAQIDEHGELRIDMVQLRGTVKKYPNQKAIVTIEVIDGGDVEMMLSWYRNYVLPKAVGAWRELGESFTTDQADEQLRCLTTACHRAMGGEKFIVTVEQLDREELIRYLDEVKLICSTNLNLVLL